MDERPISVFDSGVGGLSILRQIRLLLPNEDILFLADQAHVPYGPRPLMDVRLFAQGIASFLLEQSSKLIVVACNTASAAALHHLRSTFPSIPFVGMEPAVKPAVKTTRSRIVGVLATPATFQGKLFASVVERFAGDVTVLQKTLPNLVERIEVGDLDGPQTKEILLQAVAPLLAQGADTLVLACTHYPFIIPVLVDLVGPNVQVIDPSPAIARQAERLLIEQNLIAPADRTGSITFYTSGDADQLRKMSQRLIEESGEVRHLTWEGDRLHESKTQAH
jgi:glutamate racemase